MSQKTPLFDISDFSKYQWTEILKLTNSKKCEEYSQMFQAKAEEYRLKEDHLGQAIFSFLSRVNALWIEPIGKKNPSLLEKNISPEFSDNELNILRGLVAEINDSEMRARIADILWICKNRDSEKARPIQMAKIALESYLQSARTLEDADSWKSCYKRLMRTAQLAPLIDGKKSKTMRNLISKQIDDLINRYETVENEFLTGSSMKVLQEQLGKKHLKSIWDDISFYGNKYAAIAANKAVYAENIKEFRDYHEAYCQKFEYRHIESEWYKIVGDKESERKAKLHLAEVEVWYAQQAFVGNENSSYGVAAGRIESAIAILRKIEDTFGRRQDTSKRIEQLHKLMLDYQKESMSQMQMIPLIEENQFDDPEMQQTARDLVTGKSLCDALYSLAFGCKLIESIDDLKTKAEQDLESFASSHIITNVLIDKEGKTKAISRNGEDSLESKIFEKASFYQSWYGMNFIVPACEQICFEHDVKGDDLSFIVNENPFIPQGHELLYSRGLLAGLQQDPIIATHLLVPQLENSLRHILKQQGFIASNLTSAMIQDEYTLGKVLELQDLKKVLAEDIIFTLKGLLVERMGGNMRNEVCHGLYSYEQFFNARTIYLWWLTLFLCLVPSHRHWEEKNNKH